MHKKHRLKSESGTTYRIFLTSGVLIFSHACSNTLIWIPFQETRISLLPADTRVKKEETITAALSPLVHLPQCLQRRAYSQETHSFQKTAQMIRIEKDRERRRKKKKPLRFHGCNRRFFNMEQSNFYLSKGIYHTYWSVQNNVQTAAFSKTAFLDKFTAHPPVKHSLLLYTSTQDKCTCSADFIKEGYHYNNLAWPRKDPVQIYILIHVTEYQNKQ